MLLRVSRVMRSSDIVRQLSDDRITRETRSNSNTARALFFCPLILFYIYIYIHTHTHTYI